DRHHRCMVELQHDRSDDQPEHAKYQLDPPVARERCQHVPGDASGRSGEFLGGALEIVLDVLGHGRLLRLGYTMRRAPGVSRWIVPARGQPSSGENAALGGPEYMASPTRVLAESTARLTADAA